MGEDLGDKVLQQMTAGGAGEGITRRVIFHNEGDDDDIKVNDDVS